MGLGALGAIAGGINRGMDWAQRDQEIEDQRKFREEDREYQRGIRGFQQKQQQRQTDQWAKDDQFQQDQAAIPNVGAVKAIKDTDLGPEQVKQTESGYARDLGNALKKKGDTEGALKSWKWADEAASKAAANAVIGRLSGLPRSGADLQRLVQEIGAGVDADESPVGIDYKNVRKNPDGSVTVRAFNKNSGFGDDITVNSIDDLKEKMTWHYAPDYARAQAAERAKQQAEIAKENIKPINTPAGGVTTLRNPDGSVRETIRNTNGLINMGTDENPQWVRPGASGTGASSSTGKGAKVDDPVKNAADIVREQATKGSAPLNSTQISDAELRAAQIAARGVPAYVAANVAIKVAQDPTLLKPRLDPRTGLIENVYEDGAVGQVVVDRDVATARNPKGMTKDQLQGFAKQVVTSVSNPEAQKNLVAAAFDPEARRKVEDQLTAEIGKQFDQMLQANPNAKASIDAQRNATVKSSLEALGRKLDLINGHYPKPQVSNPTPKVDTTRGSVGGINPSRFAGKSPREIDQMVAQESRDFRAQNKRMVLDSAAAARDPDIIRLNAEKEAALRAGKPVIANAKIEEIKKIQAERHMVQR